MSLESHSRTRMGPHPRAVLQALFVTFLWSTSIILIKVGLHDLPPILFAGLRYGLAFLILLPFALRSTPVREQIAALDRRAWGLLIVLGIFFYTLTQGAQFLSLVYLPAVMQSLLLNFTVVVTALLGMAFLNEHLRARQWLGMAVFLLGVLTYFYPLQFPVAILIGIVFGLTQVVSNAVAGILGRYTNRSGRFLPLTVTTVSMGVGALGLLVTGLILEPFPVLTLQHVAIIGWLAAVNTAAAFTLWNRSLQTLSAVESSLINSTMLIQIAVLAWVFLGETIAPREMLGLGVALIGIALVQIRRRTA